MNSADRLPRNALVIGGTSGIGLAIASAFAQAGARVAVAGRGEEAGARAVEALSTQGAEACFVGMDVRDEASVAAGIAAVEARFGRLEVAANVAGIGGDMAPLESASQAVWDEVMAVNARGVWLAMRYEIPAMLRAGGGAIVNVASIYGLAGKAAHHAYVASKHAVVGPTRSVALEYATRNIRVNAICAGVTRTASMAAAEAAWPELVAGLVGAHPMARMASEAEIASAARWLCSEGAGFVTGTPLAVDGGFLAA